MKTRLQIFHVLLLAVVSHPAALYAQKTNGTIPAVPTRVPAMPAVPLALTGAIGVRVIKNTIGEWETTTATVRRNSATSNPLLVNIRISDEGQMKAVRAVKIAAGKTTSAPFAVIGIDDEYVDGTQTVTLTASANRHSVGSAVMKVTDNDVSQLSLEITGAAIAENGGITTAVVRRNADTTSELVVELSNSDPGEVATSNTVTIPAGKLTQVFNVAGLEDDIVDGIQSVAITASARGYLDGTDNVNVSDNDKPSLSVSIAHGISEHGGTTTARVTRNTDLTNPLTVQLKPSDPNEASVPGAVIIQQGQNSVEFQISGVDDVIADGTQPTTITASANSHAEGKATVNVTDDDAPELTVTIADAAIRETGNTTIATVSRNTDQSGALKVRLNNSDMTEMTCSHEITIPAGQKSAQFAIAGVDDAMVDGTQTVTISASSPGHKDGSRTVQVRDNNQAGLTVTIANPEIGENGGVTVATVSRNMDPASPLIPTPELTVGLVSSDAKQAKVERTVKIPAGEISATFMITGLDDTTVDGTRTVSITASANAYTEGSATVHVVDDDTYPLSTTIFAQPNEAIIELYCPPNAFVWINGEPTTATGRRRVYWSPMPGSAKREFTIKAGIDKLAVVAIRKVPVSPGEAKTVVISRIDFN